jgi:hypothetical protein
MSQVSQLEAPLKVTRRGRALLSFLVVAAVVATGLLFASPGAQAGAESGEATLHTVMAGESLWSIAEALAPGTDPRISIDRLMKANELSSAVIEPGTQILIPSGF